jgi:hypothetical protein
MKHKAPHHDSPDPALDQLFGEMRARIRRRERGRLFVAIQILDHLSAGTVIIEDGMTDEDFDRLMRQQPRTRATTTEGRR